MSRKSLQYRVYVYSHPEQGVKIGMTSRPEGWMQELGRKGKLEWLSRVLPNADRVEALTHMNIRVHHLGGEWFSVTPAEAVAAVEHAIKQLKRDPYIRIWRITRWEHQVNDEVRRLWAAPGAKKYDVATKTGISCLALERWQRQGRIPRLGSGWPPKVRTWQLDNIRNWMLMDEEGGDAE